jgi:hypothetical protein
MSEAGEFGYGFKHTAFSRFIASSSGRMSRAASGGALMGVGLGRGGLWGFLVTMFGLGQLLSAVLDFSVMSALMGGPFWGEDARAEELEQ